MMEEITNKIRTHLATPLHETSIVNVSTIDLLGALSFGQFRTLLETCRHQALGVIRRAESRFLSLSDILIGAGSSVSYGPIEYHRVPLGPRDAVVVPDSAVFLLEYEGEPVVVYYRLASSDQLRVIEVDVASRDVAIAEGFLRTITAPNELLQTGIVHVEDDGEAGYLTFISPRLLENRSIERLLLGSSVGNEVEVWGRRLSGHETHAATRVFAFMGPPGSGKADAKRWLAETAGQNVTLFCSDPSKAAIDGIFKTAVAYGPATLGFHFGALEREPADVEALEYLFSLVELARYSTSLIILVSADSSDRFRSVLERHPSIITDVFSFASPSAARRKEILDTFPLLSNRTEELSDALIHQTEGMSRAFILTFFERLSIYVKENSISCLTREDVLKALEDLGGADRKDRFTILGGKEFYNSFAYMFDEIKKLPDRALQELLRNVPRDVLVTALKHSSDEVRKRIYCNVSRRAELMIREDIDTLASLTKDRSLEAQRQVVEILREVVTPDYFVIDLT